MNEKNLTPARAYGLDADPRMSTAMRKAAVFGIVLLVIGAAAWFAQLHLGLIETSAMSNVYVWGLMIAVFAFLVGFGAGSQLLATVMYLTGREELRPYVLLAAVIGFGCTLAAAVAVLVDLGAIRNIFAMLLGPNLRSPLSWDMVALTLALVLSVLQLLALALDRGVVRALVVLAGLAAVVLQIVEGLLFSLQTAHAWWATPVMPVDFLAVAFVSGAALVLLVAVVRRAPAGVLAWLGRVLAIAIVVHIVLALVDLGLVCLEGTAASAGVLAALGRYAWLYAAELVLPLVAAALLLVRGRSGSTGVARVASVLTIVGMFAHRMMLLYPSYGAPSLYLKLSGTDVVTGAYPLSTGRYLDAGNAFGTTAPYLPNGMEWLAALLPVGIAIVAIAVVLAAMHLVYRRTRTCAERGSSAEA